MVHSRGLSAATALLLLLSGTVLLVPPAAAEPPRSFEDRARCFPSPPKPLPLPKPAPVVADPWTDVPQDHRAAFGDRFVASWLSDGTTKVAVHELTGRDSAPAGATLVDRQVSRAELHGVATDVAALIAGTAWQDFRVRYEVATVEVTVSTVEAQADLAARAAAAGHHVVGPDDPYAPASGRTAMPDDPFFATVAMPRVAVGVRLPLEVLSVLLPRTVLNVGIGRPRDDGYIIERIHV